MKTTKSVFIALGLLVLVAALYRVFPNRPWGFTPQYAMAIFSGAIFIKNKQWAFALPVLSMFLGDLFYHLLYSMHLTNTPGFYEGQWQNYILFALLTSMGFLLKKINVLNVAIVSVIAPCVFFIASNFVVWAGWQGTRGLNRPKTFEGLLMAYNDAIPFTFPGGIYSTVLFSALLFGGYFFIKRSLTQEERTKHLA